MAFSDAGFTKVIFMENVCEYPSKTINEMDEMSEESDEPGPIGFRPPKDLRGELVDAQKVTGKTATYLIVQCCKKSLRMVVQEQVEAMKDDFAARQKAAREFLKQRKAA